MNERARFNRIIAFLLAFVMIVGFVPAVNVYAAENSWTISDNTDIFWVKNSDSEGNYQDLSEQVRLFSSELAEKVTGKALDIVYGDDSDYGTNDIILVLDSSSGIAAQGYVVSVEENGVKISASDADGLFYGCRYLIKELAASGSVAAVTDAPHVAERAVSLDNGRKYFSVDWIKEFIREMSWANMNALALHFSEEMGLGIESQLYPWLAGRDGELGTQAEVADDERYLTFDEVREICEYAKLYHVQIIPSLDSPGHMNYIVKKFNEKCENTGFSFTYNGQTYDVPAGYNIGNYFSYDGKTTAVVPGSRNTKYSRGIDISDEIAVAFTKSLIEEYGRLFADLGSTKFDIGGDELLGWGSAVTSSVSRWRQLDHWKAYAQERTGNSNAVAYDAFLLYMNDLNDLVRDLGYTSVRMWNDDALRSSDTGWTGVVELDINIDIWFWTTGNNIFYDYAVADYQLYNILSDYNYYAMTDDFFAQDSNNRRDSFTQAYADEIYNEWNPYIFYPDDLNAGWKYNPGVTNPNVLGGAFGIWCDNPSLRTEEEVMSDVLPLIRANAAKSWDVDVNDTVDYDTYVAKWNKVGAAPEGTVEAPEIYTGADLTALEKAVAEFEMYQEAEYTAATFTAYRNAVEAGKKLLNADKPLQNDVNAAVQQIEAAKKALVKKTVVDTADLEAAIAAYDECDMSRYTALSFAEYTKAIHAAEVLLSGDDYTEVEVVDALYAIEKAVDGLVEVGSDGVECILQGAAKSTRVYVGKVVTVSVSTDKSVEVEDLLIVDDTGKIVNTCVKFSMNTRDDWRNLINYIFQVGAEDVGMRTYTVYVVFADGTVSADYLQFDMDVRK